MRGNGRVINQAIKDILRSTVKNEQMIQGELYELLKNQFIKQMKQFKSLFHVRSYIKQYSGCMKTLYLEDKFFQSLAKKINSLIF